MSTLRTILRRYTEQALETARELGLDLKESDLSYFVRTIQSNKAVMIRKVSKTTTVFLVYRNNQRCYVVYNNRYKSVVGFLKESDARFNRNEDVLVLLDDTWVKGKIVYVLPAYENPRKPSVLGRFRSRGYEVSELQDSEESLRPQYSYVVGIEEGGQKKVIWPPSSKLRKVEHVTTHNGNH